MFGPQDVPVDHADFDPQKQLGASFLLAAVGQHAEMFHLLWEELKHRYRTKAFDQDAFYDYIQLRKRTAPATWIRAELEDDMEFIGSIDRAKRDGRTEGIKTGEVLAYQQGIRELAATRGITLTPDSEAKLKAATEPKQLSRWLIEVGTAETPSLTLSDVEE